MALIFYLMLLDGKELTVLLGQAPKCLSTWPEFSNSSPFMGTKQGLRAIESYNVWS
jgi:hypothetical protein